MRSAKLLSFGVHAAAVAWIYQAHLAAPPALPPPALVELVEPLHRPPPPPPAPPQQARPEPPPEGTRARVQPRAAAEPPPEHAATEALPVPPAPPAPEDAPIGQTVGTETDMRAPVPIDRPDPKYPRRAERMGREGWVTLRFTILASGEVSEIEIVDAKPPGFFEDAASAAVSRWRYRPGLWNGVPVAVPGVLTRISFELRS